MHQKLRSVVAGLFIFSINFCLANNGGFEHFDFPVGQSAACTNAHNLQQLNSSEGIKLLYPAQPTTLTGNSVWCAPDTTVVSPAVFLFNESQLTGLRLVHGKTRIELNDNSLLEAVIDGEQLCQPERAIDPDNIDIQVHSGTLVWNGCGQVSWPESVEVQRVGNSWQLSTQASATQASGLPKSATTVNATSTEKNSSNSTSDHTWPLEAKITFYVGLGVVVAVMVLVLSCGVKNRNILSAALP